MKILTVINNDYAVTDETTYRQLKDLLPDTTGVKTPTKDWIKDNEPICSVKFDGGETQVYANGFYTYSVGNNSTILRVDGFSYVKYSFGDGDISVIDEQECSWRKISIKRSSIIIKCMSITKTTAFWWKLRHRTL